MSDQQIRPGHCLPQVRVAITHRRIHEPFHEEPWSGLRVHDLLDQFRILLFRLWNVGPHGRKLQPRALDLLAIDLHRRDDGSVPSPLELEGDRDVRVNVTKRSKCVQDNSHCLA